MIKRLGLKIAAGVALLAVLGAVLWIVADQAKAIGTLEREKQQVAESLKGAEAEKLRMMQLREADSQSLRMLAIKRRAAESDTAKILTELRKALKDEPCAATPLPQPVADRLRNRIHRQARAGAGTPPG